jgi:two-component system alkaline phosphatase synthesis response regulator PhoP
MDHKGKTILIADDEPDIVEIISYNLKMDGYDVIAAKDGDEALQKAKLYKPDLIILDVMMPYKNGMEVCRTLRSLPQFSETLIIFLTALSDEFSHVKGLEYGADDYLTKPISPKVLTSKVNSLFRRLSKPEDDKVLQAGELKIDPVQFLVQYKGQDITLAKKEFELLYLLASKPGRVFLRNEILSQIWGTEVIVGDRTIDVHIRKIRQKLGLDCITTVKGVGYKFDISN